jgi:hypothetical protein
MAFNLRKYSQQAILQTKPMVVPPDTSGLLETKPVAAKTPEPADGPKAGSGPGKGGSVFGKKRIRDRGIKWEEVYGEKSDDLKARFEQQLGPGVYMRFEGHDYTTDGDYFVIVGPAITADEKKKFFAGIKRMPEDPTKPIYSPSGEYFSSSHGAFSHANEKWGVPFPKGTANVTEGQLANIKIPRHVKG